MCDGKFVFFFSHYYYFFPWYMREIVYVPFELAQSTLESFLWTRASNKEINSWECLFVRDDFFLLLFTAWKWVLIAFMWKLHPEKNYIDLWLAPVFKRELCAICHLDWLTMSMNSTVHVVNEFISHCFCIATKYKASMLLKSIPFKWTVSVRSTVIIAMAIMHFIFISFVRTPKMSRFS